MNKITYLFGAGASCEALPIVNQIPDRIINLIEFLKSDEFVLDNEFYKHEAITKDKSKRELQLEMIESLQWMLNESKNHASIDTFAKKLFITQKRTQLNHLKLAMSVFFIFNNLEMALIKDTIHFLLLFYKIQ